MFREKIASAWHHLAIFPQVLQDGMNSYIYGIGNLAQTNGSTTDYFLPDALGSTRQLVNRG